MRSIGLCRFSLSNQGGIGHDFFDLVGTARESLAEKFEAGFGHEHVVFDAHAEIFFGNVFEQACVILRSSKNKESAKQFLSFVKTAAIGDLLRSYGFDVEGNSAK